MGQQIAEAAAELGAKLIKFNAEAPRGLTAAIKVILELGGADIERLARNRQLLRSLHRFVGECIKAAEGHADENRRIAKRMDDPSVTVSSPEQ